MQNVAALPCVPPTPCISYMALKNRFPVIFTKRLKLNFSISKNSSVSLLVCLLDINVQWLLVFAKIDCEDMLK